MGECLDWLHKQVKSVHFEEHRFSLYTDPKCGKYIFGAFLRDKQAEQPDYFSIATIYDTAGALKEIESYFSHVDIFA